VYLCILSLTVWYRVIWRYLSKFAKYIKETKEHYQEHNKWEEEIKKDKEKADKWKKYKDLSQKKLQKKDKKEYEDEIRMDELKKDLTHYLDKVEWLGDQKFGQICNSRKSEKN
jgi:hypothetical protein